MKWDKKDTLESLQYTNLSSVFHKAYEQTNIENDIVNFHNTTADSS